MTDLLFYHLETRPLESVLPMLLEKTIERGWRAVVEVGSVERLETIEAREVWRTLKPVYDLTYWQQDEGGRWSKKA